MKHDIVLYILVMTVVTLAIRLVPLTLLRRPIKNRCLRSFLYYVPYVTLAVMTFPAIVEATQIPAAGGVCLHQIKIRTMPSTRGIVRIFCLMVYFFRRLTRYGKISRLRCRTPCR